MNLTEQIAYLDRRISQCNEVAEQTRDIPLLHREAVADAKALTEIRDTIATERKRQADHAADWS